VNSYRNWIKFRGAGHILQVGVGFYHQQNANWRGATGLLRNGTVRLREFEPEALGIDVSKLVWECERCLRELEDLGRERVREFDQSKAPKVEWVQEKADSQGADELIG
jgi:hypothetical protein